MPDRPSACPPAAPDASARRGGWWRSPAPDGGSGKSALALALAEALDGVVINADSMQVYRELAILTARPGPGRRGPGDAPALRHPAAASPCSAARWRGPWRSARSRRRSGGPGRPRSWSARTGLYLRALVEGIAEIPPCRRRCGAAAEARLAEIGGAAFRAELARARSGDRRAAVRQRPPAADPRPRGGGRDPGGRSAPGSAARPLAPPAGAVFDLIALLPPRAALHAACDGRFDAMMAAGAVEEVAALDALGLDPSLRR